MATTTTGRRQGAREPLDHDPDALRKRRIEQGLLQKDVAATAGVSPGYISELESGTRNPSAAVLRRLAETLQCTTADLMARRNS